MLNAPFCPIKQKLRKKQSEVSMVKIPQHKVTKFNKFFRGSFSYFLSNPIEYLQRLFISNPANQSKDLGKKTGEIEIIREIKSLRIDILLINKKKEYIIGVLLPIIHSQQKYHIFICFDVFSAYYNTIICVSVL